MAYLLKGVRQADLVNLAEELQLPASPNMKLTELRNLILNSENYEEELTRDILTIIVETRIEGERANSLSNQALNRNVAGQSNPYKYQPDIQKLIPKFNSGETDISLYLVIFERYMKRFNINQSDWVSHLMGYLPADIVQVLAREPEEQAENYEHIKKLLLKRFKLSPEVFRQKFVHHQKKAEGTWRDFLFEAQNYLEEWLKGMEVDDFESLKDLMIADQMKKRVSGEVQEHFADEWTMIKSSSLLADMLDNYEMVRKPKKKPFEKWYRTEKPHPPMINKQSNKTGNTSRLTHTREEHREEKNSRSRLPDMFERRRALKCFECNEPGHLRPQCPRLAKQRSEKVEPVNHVKERDINPFLDPYVKPGLVNGIEIEFLRDSGSTIDLVSRRYVKPEFYCGENIWVKQPLDEHYISLPLAIVEISGEFGKVRTKAAVFADSLDQGRYILGNRTAALIEEKKMGELTGFEPINAVQTR
ncbi:hypothetical protein AVEN_129274-1, partial [Araneus ventricosus]